MRRQFPVPIRGIDTDNDSAFIDETLQGYCQEQHLEFTRSRAYQKNDQAWIEQKNGSVIRRFVGYHRFSGLVAGQCLARLYRAVRLYVNFFHPWFELQSKTREGAKVKKRYHKPATPCDRLLAHGSVSTAAKEALERSSPNWIHWRFCIRSANANPPWLRSIRAIWVRVRNERAWRRFSPSFPSCGVKGKRVRPTGVSQRRRTLGGLGKILSRGYGRRLSCGCNKIPIQRPSP